MSHPKKFFAVFYDKWLLIRGANYDALTGINLYFVVVVVVLFVGCCFFFSEARVLNKCLLLFSPECVRFSRFPM